MVTINKKENMKKVMVLMSTYNGEKYLETQLDSILAQEGVQVEILVRDDGSTDTTLSILNKYKQKGKLNYYTGPNVGPTRSFMDLIHKAPKSDFYAFSDQDDYWLPGKLKKAVQSIGRYVNSNIPVLYHTTVIFVDENLNIISKRKIPAMYAQFSKVITGSFGHGCTMVFNSSLSELIRRYIPSCCMMYDEWIYKICLAVNGKTIYDKEPSLYFRRHNKTVTGHANTSFLLKIKRILLRPYKYKNYYSQAIREIMKGYQELMPGEHIKLCERLSRYNENVNNKIVVLLDNQFYTGNLKKDFLFIINILRGSF